jgi:hypothetical protein
MQFLKYLPCVVEARDGVYCQVKALQSQSTDLDKKVLVFPFWAEQRLNVWRAKVCHET